MFRKLFPMGARVREPRARLTCLLYLHVLHLLSPVTSPPPPVQHNVRAAASFPLLKKAFGFTVSGLCFVFSKPATRLFRIFLACARFLFSFSISLSSVPLSFRTPYLSHNAVPVSLTEFCAQFCACVLLPAFPIMRCSSSTLGLVITMFVSVSSRHMPQTFV